MRRCVTFKSPEQVAGTYPLAGNSAEAPRQVSTTGKLHTWKFHFLKKSTGFDDGAFQAIFHCTHLKMSQRTFNWAFSLDELQFWKRLQLPQDIEIFRILSIAWSSALSLDYCRAFQFNMGGSHQATLMKKKLEKKKKRSKNFTIIQGKAEFCRQKNELFKLFLIACNKINSVCLTKILSM